MCRRFRPIGSMWGAPRIDDVGSEDAMTTRQQLSNGVLAATVAALALAAVPADAQSGKTSAQPAAQPKTTGFWAPSKTPWGDPDIEGVWTSDAAYTIPFARPTQFAGRA